VQQTGQLGNTGAPEVLSGLGIFDMPGAYAYETEDPEDAIATTDYGGPVTAVIARGNLAGLQFHVEKSGPVGLTMLANFLRWEP
jgi:imidazoleglycerol phosphate synthase glutamine amidotransferase subunit HisH